MSAFDVMDAMDQAYLLTYWRTLDRMAAWERQLEIDEAERRAKANK